MDAITPKKMLDNLAHVTGEWLQQAQSHTNRESIKQYSSQLSKLLDERSELREKRSCANAQIGKQRRAGQDVSKLIGNVRELSTQIKGLDALMDDTCSKMLKLQPMSDSTANKLLSTASSIEPDSVTTGKPGQFLEYRFVDVDATHKEFAVEIAECQNELEWDTYLAQHSGSTHYHQYAWRALIDRNFGHTSFYLEARHDDGSLSGILPVVHMKSTLFGSFLLSMPWLIYGGAVASDNASHRALGNHLKQLMLDRKCSHVDLREVHSREGWMDIKGKVAMVRTLPNNPTTFNTSLRSKLRSQIKRANRVKPMIRFGGSELVPEFYRVFSEKMRDLGTPVYHQNFFEDIARTFPDSAVFVVVMVGGQPAAAACLLGYRDTLEVPWAAARKRYNKDGINMYMYHAMLEEAIKRGYRFFDFGRSTTGEATYRFKQQWGAEPYALEWQRYPKSVSAEEAGQPGMLMLTASSIWTRMPLALTNLLGPKIARNLPW